MHWSLKVSNKVKFVRKCKTKTTVTSTNIAQCNHLTWRLGASGEGQTFEWPPGPPVPPSVLESPPVEAGLRKRRAGRPSGPRSSTSSYSRSRYWMQLIYHMRSADHITDALASLHWLRVLERIEFKIAVLTYKVLHGFAPWSFLPSFARVAISPVDEHCALVPSVRLSKVGSRDFTVAGPCVRDDVSTITEDFQSTSVKTWLFRQSSSDLIIWSHIHLTTTV